MQLGGPRKPKVTVTEEGDDYVAEVRFLPVTGFDPATNAKLNRGKGRDYALRGLAAHITGKKNSLLTLSESEITKSGLDDNVFKLTFRISKSNVRLQQDDGEEVEVHSPEVPGGRRKKQSSLPARSALFTRRDDILDTLDRLHEHYTSEAERASLVLVDDELSTRISEIRDEVERDFDRFVKEVEEDKLLDFIERGDISARVQIDRREILDRLKDSNESRTKER